MSLIAYHPPTMPAFDLLYGDDQLLVFNKPSGLLTVPGRAIEHRDSLALRVQRIWPEARIVHRLDMATSGLIVMAIGADAQRKLNRQFETRATAKTYHALIWGEPNTEQGTVDLPLRCDWPNRPKQMVDVEAGKPSQTDWRVLAKHGNYSEIELTPITGRSHQLRVHMLSQGHPILGDRLYAHDQALAMASRLQLHASTLSLYHPLTNEWLTFSAPCPFLGKPLAKVVDKQIGFIANN
ncbi:RNA pseudouridine synthase [Corallincola holothuriorum]|uniref:Dual-specificity RNA pseudouridine synthase RluA n=1 Tax=Corallincola holothuriorum TaxID=2282215 RepID=A0A368NJY0_9GAMM|nr:pseudouridine synthase [Corallincola holothuriorum]RCU49954.1 RNA pseudouridine synthase [Corallincola holothuriorum]